MLADIEKLENRLSKSVNDKLQVDDTVSQFTDRDQATTDSILNRLHKIVLYEDQRKRIDTLTSLFKANAEMLTNPGSDRTAPTLYNTTEVITRAKQFAQKSLKEQREAFESHASRMNTWVNLILIFSFTLFAIGIWSTFAESSSKRKLKNFHEAILTKASIGVCVFSKKGNRENHAQFALTFANPGAVVRRVEDNREVLINLADHSLRDRVLFRDFQSVLFTGKSITKEISYFSEGETYWFITNTSRVSSDTVAFYYQDISKIKLFESELNKKVSELETVNKDLEQFAHATSHDLREPFRKIQIMADLLSQKHNAGNETKYIDTIIKAATKGSQLVEQILNYSKVQFDNSKQEIINLKDLVQRVVDDFELVILEKEATVIIRDLPEIYGNHIQMVQLFSNLISNALKFTSPDRKPVLEIWAEETNGSTKLKTLNPLMKYNVITVQDNGIGFRDTHKERIFTAFERLNNYTDFPGFGLGLSLCKKIALNHKGDIEATSTLNAGSKFVLYVPKLQEAS